MTDIKLFTGCFLGLALGDALCAPFEGGILERALWKLIGKTKDGKTRYTDDTQMSMDVATSLCQNKGVHQGHLAKTFAANYRWSRGYGAGAAKMLKKIYKGAKWQDVNRSIYPTGSFGNGAAMRAPIVALYFHNNTQQMSQATQEVSEITHTHPLALEGANLIASAVSFALKRSNFSELFPLLRQKSNVPEYQNRLHIAQQWLDEKSTVESTTVAKQLGNGIAAIDSCPTALYIASRYIDLPFNDMLYFIQKCSGDTDTISAMAGAIWGAYNGQDGLDNRDIEQLESAHEIQHLAEELHHQHKRIFHE